jgi:hypothetical protein
MAIPVGIEPTMQVRGKKVELGIKVGELAITDKMIWLGAEIRVEVEGAPPPKPKAPASSGGS